MQRARTLTLLLVALSMAVAPMSQSYGAAPPPEGSFDPAWSGDGIVAMPMTPTLNVYAVARQSDGKIVLAGNSGQQTMVMRLNADGSLDHGFGSSGMVTKSVGSGFSAAYAVAMQPDDKIVLAGEADNATVDVSVLRFTSNGTLDPQFDGDGVKIVDLGKGESGAAVAVQPDGKIVVGGTTGNSSTADGFVVRLLPSGALDTSFAGDGSADTTGKISVKNYVDAMALGPAGAIVTCGYQDDGTHQRLLAVRYTATGGFDTTFDGDGVAVVTSTDDTTIATGAAVTSSGAIVCAGSLSSATSTHTLVARFTAHGALDPTYNGNGLALSDVPTNADEASGVAVQHDGKVVTAGLSGDGRMVVERFTNAGAMDTTFKGTGYVAVKVGGDPTFANGVLVQPDGKIVAAGGSQSTPESVVAIRLLGDTTPPTAPVLKLQRLSAHKATARWGKATDVGTGVVSYDVQRRQSPLSGGALGPWATVLSKTHLTRLAVKMPEQRKVCLRVRAHDAAGNIGAYSPAACLRGT